MTNEEIQARIEEYRGSDEYINKAFQYLYREMNRDFSKCHSSELIQQHISPIDTFGLNAFNLLQKYTSHYSLESLLKEYNKRAAKFSYHAKAKFPKNWFIYKFIERVSTNPQFSFLFETSFYVFSDNDKRFQKFLSSFIK